MFAEIAQTKLDADLRVSLYRLGQQNGGLRSLAEKAHVSYNALWGQMNRGQGILAEIIPPITRAAHDPVVLELIANACDYLIVPRPHFKRTQRPEIRRGEVDLSIAVGQALGVIESALRNGFICNREYGEIRRALNHVCEHSLGLQVELDLNHFLRREG